MPRRYSKRSKAKTGSQSPFATAILWFFALALSLWLIAVQWTSQGGRLGESLNSGLNTVFGQSAYLFPIVLLYGLIRIFTSKTAKGVFSLGAGTAILCTACSIELEILRNQFPDSSISGGAIGTHVTRILVSIFGGWGAALLGIALLLSGVHILFAISWSETFKHLTECLKEDFETWKNARAELSTQKVSAKDGTLKIQRATTAASADSKQEKKPEEPAPPLKITRAEASRPAPEKQEEPAPRKEEKKPLAAAEAKAAPQKPGREEGKPALQKPNEWHLPDVALLRAPQTDRSLGPTDQEIFAAKHKLEETLKSFNIAADVTGVSPGPVVTRYEIKPRPGVKVSSIVNLSNDIALAMKARGIRVEAPIPGKDAIGFEIPNEKPAMVTLREIIEDPLFTTKKTPLIVALGRYAEGASATANIEKMPHLLVAGATNSGKSICLHSMIMSILFRASPEHVKFLFIDPKRLEMTFYENIPHLYDPKVHAPEASVVTDPKGAVKSLLGLVRVMETRYKVFEQAKVKNIESYNRWAKENGKPPAFYIVVVIDELADLMLQTKAAVEDSIQRLAQMARAVGIHLILATQRPSVDVITGVIKANLPSRIALQVASKVDSKVILDSPGADSLLGKGDMLFLAIDAQKPSRIQGAYVSEEEIKAVADFWRAQGGPSYEPPLADEPEEEDMEGGHGGSPAELKEALRLILERRRVSQDLLKAHFGSSARATNILSILEMKGFINKPEGSNRWEILFDKIEHQLAVLEQKSMMEDRDSIEEEIS